MWPLSSDYSEAVQNPRLRFRDKDLKNSTASVNADGIPLIATGASACVFKLTGPQGSFAARCFTREVTDQQKRYEAISLHLGNYSSPYFSQFEYQADGILVGKNRRPLVKMEWVEGKTLQLYVEGVLHDPQGKIQVLAKKFRALAGALNGIGMAHGDLQHGNIMVTTQEDLKLVDYDSMFVPSLANEEAPELGHPNFQHPRLHGSNPAPRTYGPDMDSFSAHVIYLSLIALDRDPTLWKLHHNGDNLIFSQGDFANPGQSAVFNNLCSCPDPTIRLVAAALRNFCAGSPDNIPTLEETLQPRGPGRPPRPPHPPRPSFRIKRPRLWLGILALAAMASVILFLHFSHECDYEVPSVMPPLRTAPGSMYAKVPRILSGGKSCSLVSWLINERSETRKNLQSLLDENAEGGWRYLDADGSHPTVFDFGDSRQFEGVILINGLDGNETSALARINLVFDGGESRSIEPDRTRGWQVLLFDPVKSIKVTVSAADGAGEGSRGLSKLWFLEGIQNKSPGANWSGTWKNSSASIKLTSQKGAWVSGVFTENQSAKVFWGREWPTDEHSILQGTLSSGMTYNRDSKIEWAAIRLAGDGIILTLPNKELHLSKE